MTTPTTAVISHDSKAPIVVENGRVTCNADSSSRRQWALPPQVC